LLFLLSEDFVKPHKLPPEVAGLFLGPFSDIWH
jgi:hypothetical protein